jgi:hypothetical protein
LRQLFQNSDFDNKFLFFITLGVCLIWFWFIIEKISTELNIKKITLITYILIIGTIVIFATRNLELYKFPKSVLDIIGYIFGIIIFVLIATCYIASTKKIRNVSKKTFFENIEEWIALKIGDSAKDIAKILIVFFIILSFFFPTVLIAVVPMLIGSFFQKEINYLINRDYLPQRTKQEKVKVKSKKK